MQRFNMKLTDDLHVYFKSESERTGVSMASLIVLALESYVQERQAVKLMKDMPDLFEQLKKFQEMQSKIGG